MNAAKLWLAVLVATAACTGSSSGREHVTLGPLGFDVPDTWSRSDTSFRGVTSSEWKPAGRSDESLVVLRTEKARLVATVAPESLGTLLAQAQTGLPGVRLSEARPLVTPNGLSASRISLELERPGTPGRFHREHVVLVEGDALVHVIHTSQRADKASTVLSMVLDSLRREEQ